MGFDKLMAPLWGDPVIRHTLRAFAACEDIHGIWIVAGRERAGEIQEAGPMPDKFRGFVEGGAERHLSVDAGLLAVPPEYALVAVHDGARPLIHPSQISRCLEEARRTGAAASARRITDTVKRADSQCRVTGGIDRAGLWAMETPQVFRLDLLRAAYARVMEEEALVTDEVSAVEHTGHDVYLVENPWPNLKITLPGDLETAALLMAGKTN